MPQYSFDNMTNIHSIHDVSQSSFDKCLVNIQSCTVPTLPHLNKKEGLNGVNR